MERAVFLYMRHGLVNAVNYSYREDKIKILVIPVGLGRLFHVRKDGHGFVATLQRDAGLAKPPGQHRKKSFGNTAVYQQGFHGIADPRSLNLGVQTDLCGHAQVRAPIHINVANTFVMFEDRYFRVFHHEADQSLATPWNDQIDEPLLFQQEVDRRPVRGGNDLNRFFRQAGSCQACGNQISQRTVGMNRFGSAP